MGLTTKELLELTKGASDDISDDTFLKSGYTGIGKSINFSAKELNNLVDDFARLLIKKWHEAVIRQAEQHQISTANLKKISLSNSQLLDFVNEFRKIKKVKPTINEKPVSARQPVVREQHHYYLVTCKCGHVGRTKYILITFPIKAETKKQAAEIARNTPRVKHHHKDYLKEIQEVSYDKYLQQKKINATDHYLLAKNSSYQDFAAIWDRLLDEK